jgi:hypothetical protein
MSDEEHDRFIPAVRHADLSIDRSQGTDHIRECPNCREWRHRSAFPAGRRFCNARACQEKEGMELVAVARAAVDARRMRVAAELDTMLEEPKPEGVKGVGWRITHLRIAGMSHEAIADELGMKVGRVRHEEEAAMRRLHTIARERIGVQA